MHLYTSTHNRTWLKRGKSSGMPVGYFVLIYLECFCLRVYFALWMIPSQSNMPSANGHGGLNTKLTPDRMSATRASYGILNLSPCSWSAMGFVETWPYQQRIPTAVTRRVCLNLARCVWAGVFDSVHEVPIAKFLDTEFCWHGFPPGMLVMPCPGVCWSWVRIQLRRVYLKCADECVHCREQLFFTYIWKITCVLTLPFPLSSSTSTAAGPGGSICRYERKDAR